MSDVKVERKATMSRQDAARWIADLADALAGDGRATLEFELTWSTVRPEAVVPTPARPAETEEPAARV